MSTTAVAPGHAERTVGELVLAALYLQPTDERESALRVAAKAVDDAESGAATLALESHGVLGLARRNLERAGAKLSDALDTALEERSTALREDDRCFRLTLERFLAETAAKAIDVTLLKGAALALDLYPAPALRSQADLDLLVDEHDVDAALACAARAGLVQDERSLPVWWYRRAHFHVKLRPTLPMLRQVELHWALQHPSQLRGPSLEDVRARRRATRAAGHPVLVLDPLDRLLHLVTHLASHADAAPGPSDREHLLHVAATPAHPLRLKWMLDVRAELEARDVPLDALLEHAAEWKALADLRWCLTWIRSALGLQPRADELVRGLIERTGDEPPGARASRSAATRGERVLPGLDFRPAALARIPRWIWPPADHFADTGARGGSLFLHRVGHALRTGTTGLATAAALPAALIARRMQRTERRRALESARAPERVLDVAARWREMTREEEASSTTKERTGST